jgi:hypothetical protein
MRHVRLHHRQNLRRPMHGVWEESTGKCFCPKMPFELTAGLGYGRSTYEHLDSMSYDLTPTNNRTSNLQIFYRLRLRV